MNSADVQLLMMLIEIGAKTAAAIKQIKDNNPEAYAAVSAHHAQALANLEAAAS